MFMIRSSNLTKERHVMNQSIPQPVPNPLSPATLDVLLNDTMDSLPHHPQATAAEKTTRREAAGIAVASLRPRDPFEAMLAAGIIAAHYHMMDSMRCAVRPELPAELHLRFVGRGIALSNLMMTMQRDLEQRQTREALRPVGLPVPVPGPRPEPVPVAARTEPPPAPVRQHAAPAPAPVVRPTAPTAAPQQATTVATGSATRVPELDAATQAVLLAEIAQRTATSAAALAA
jgi:hypothetical protein